MIRISKEVELLATIGGLKARLDMVKRLLSSRDKEIGKLKKIISDMIPYVHDAAVKVSGGYTSEKVSSIIAEARKALE